MAIADTIAKIAGLMKEIQAKLGSGSAISADLREKANTAISDANQAIKDWKKGGITNDVEAAGELAKTLAELTEIFKAL
ncbi:MAG: hypothetical protein ACREMY_02405 [bacterium]